MCSSSIRFQYDREEYGIGKSVRDTVASAETVSYSVYISDITLGKCRSGEIRGAEHVTSCSFIISIFICSLQVIEDQLDRFDRCGAGLLRS